MGVGERVGVGVGVGVRVGVGLGVGSGLGSGLAVGCGCGRGLGELDGLREARRDGRTLGAAEERGRQLVVVVQSGLHALTPRGLGGGGGGGSRRADGGVEAEAAHLALVADALERLAERREMWGDMGRHMGRYGEKRGDMGSALPSLKMA